MTPRTSAQESPRAGRLPGRVAKTGQHPWQGLKEKGLERANLVAMFEAKKAAIPQGRALANLVATIEAKKAAIPGNRALAGQIATGVIPNGRQGPARERDQGQQGPLHAGVRSRRREWTSRRKLSSRIVWIWMIAHPGPSREANHVAHVATAPRGPRTGKAGPPRDLAAASQSGKAVQEFREKIGRTSRKER